MTDLKSAIRTVIRNPGFSGVVVLTLALGIGANTAIFSVVRAVLLDPLPYEKPERLVMVWEDASTIGFPENTPAPANYADWKALNTVFSGMGALSERSYNLTGEGEPQRLQGRQVTYEVFPVLGVKPVAGRLFTQQDDRPGAAKVAVISFALWTQRFHRSHDVIGRKLVLDGEPHIVTGVMPAGFDFPDKGTSLWTPMAFTPQQLARRGNHYLRVVARMKTGVTLDQARTEMQVIARRMAEQYPENKNVGARVVPLRDQLIGKTRTALILLLCVAGSVLLIACANIANLLLARAVNRRKELAVRIALGAGMTRLLRQLLTESLLLSLAGGAAGVLLAARSLEFLRILIPDDLTSAALRIDDGMLLFALSLCGLTAFLFGVLPSRHAWRFGLAESINQSSTRAGEHRSSHRLRSLLVVWQAALAVMLVTAAGLLVKTYSRLSAVDPGFRAENVLTMRTSLPWYRHRDQKLRDAFYRQVLQRIEALPGVLHAGYVTWLPYTNFGGTSSFVIEGKPLPPPGEYNDANLRLASPGYFPAMGMTLLRGRLLTDADAVPAAPSVVINETMARKFWAGENALDRRFRYCDECPWIRVTGITRDLHQKSVDTEPRPELFIHYSQLGFVAPQDLAIRFSGDAAALAKSVRGAVWSVDPQQPIADVKLLSDYLDQDLAPRRFQSQLLGGFAALAVLLASLGIYGVLAYAVSQRQREIGVRLALGAEPGDVRRLVLSQGVRPALIGLLLGLAASFGLARFIASLLYDVRPHDPVVFTGSALILIAIVLLAGWLPAWRAGSIHPMEALRHE